MSFFRRLIAWLFAPSLRKLEREATKLGLLTLQHTALASGLGWSCSLRARQDGGGPRYAWTSTGTTMKEAIADCIEQAKGYPIGVSPVINHAPKLGGRQFDE